jgi:diaminopimelate decarboxylase
LTLTEFFSVNDHNHLTIDGVDCVELAETYGTPLFVISENAIRANYRQFFQAFQSRYPRIIVCASTKANYGLAVRRVFAQEGAGADCFGVNELYITLLAGTDPTKIVMNGSNKSDTELTMAIQLKVHINIDNLDELDRVNQIAQRLGKIADISLRLKPSLHSLTDAYIIDKRFSPPQILVQWYNDQKKFGMDAPTAFQACQRALSMSHVRLSGLMTHGGDVRRAGYSRPEVEEVFDFIGTTHRQLAWIPERVNLGGAFVHALLGTGQYPEGVVVPTINEYAEAIISTVREKLDEYELSEPTLIFEPGRWLTSNIAVLLGRVGVVKEVLGVKKWVHIDASTNSLNWVGDLHMIVANNAHLVGTEIVDVVGPLCDSADILGAAKKLPSTKRGDLIAIFNVGCYCESHSSNLNAYSKPATVMVRHHDNALVRRRETVQDIIALENVPTWLL